MCVCVNVKRERPLTKEGTAPTSEESERWGEKSDRERRVRDLTKDGTAPTSEEITGSAIAIASSRTHPTLSPLVGYANMCICGTASSADAASG